MEVHLKMKRSKKLVSLLLCAVTLLCAFPVFSSGADSEFEKSLSAFPKSYHAALRSLHEKHPTWIFSAMITGLDWNTAVENESSGRRSTFPNYCTDIFKSVKEGDYNYSTGSYINKDGGFVSANSLAVSYYMDPRNFLNEYSIFQFEDLSYNECFDEAAVEYVLRGTFMYNTKISYYNANGKLIKTNRTYSQVICEAGKKWNINPCYLAAKIRGEVGGGTSATSGKNSTYPGIYNFYNIGASDGAGAIERGLSWAKSGTTYSRPWNTPRKSIIGGAEFVASSYIAQGQYTAYLQKFNVNSASTYGVYNHQYMTNVCAAAFQAYYSFDSYDSANLLENKFVFSIPVFKNMDDQSGTDGKNALSDASNLSGVIDTDGNINVRNGPSTNNKRFDFMLPSGTKVTVLETVKTDALYYQNVLNYPFWYKISFTYQSKKYTGYVPKSFVKITSSVGVTKGAYEPSFTGKKAMKLLSFNEQIAKIDGSVINFLKEGSVEIAAYDSTGRFSVARYTVTDTGAPSAVLDLKQSNTTTSSFTLSWKKSEGATGYTVYKYDNAKKAYIALKTTTATKYTVSPGSAGNVGTYAVKARRKIDGTVYMSAFSKSIVASTLPSAPTGLSESSVSSDRYTLSWNAVNGASGYTVYKYDKTGEKFIKLEETTEPKTEILAVSAAQKDKYKVLAFIKTTAGKLNGSYSSEFTAVSAPDAVKSPKLSNIKENAYTISWSSVHGAGGYTVFKFSSSTGKFEKVGSTKKTSYTVSGLKTGSNDIYKIRAYTSQNGKTFDGAFSPEISASTLPGVVSKLWQAGTNPKSYTLRWKNVAGADGYRVYKYDSSKKKYVFLKDTEENRLSFTDLKSGKTDKYKVRAFVELGGKKYFSAFSPEFEAVTAPAKVKNLKAKSVSSSAYTLSWSKVSGAYGYRIFRLDKKTGSYVKVATIRGNTYRIKAKSGATEETLVVRAFIRHGGNYFGNASKPITVKLK